MPSNAFIGRTEAPTEPELAAVLGEAKSTWDQLLAELEQEFGVNVREWSSYSPKAGWSLRLKRKSRTVAWLGPREGAFMVAFILGQKAMDTARASRLPQRILRILQEAPRYPEGTGVRIMVKSSSDLAPIKSLTSIKLAN
jgi:hypothetical protein